MCVMQALLTYLAVFYFLVTCKLIGTVRIVIVLLSVLFVYSTLRCLRLV